MKRVALISGGSEGLGREMGRTLAGGYQVVLLARSAGKLAAAAARVGGDYVVADVSDASAVEAAVEQVRNKYGGIDVLINSAGIWTEGQLESNKPETIRAVLETNTLGTIFLARAVLPHMKRQGGGVIVNIISQAGVTIKAERSVYYASKWAITGFTKCLQAELSGQNIAVVGIYPGKMATGMFVKAGVEKDLTAALEPQVVARLVEFVLDSPSGVVYPEVGVRTIGEG